MIDSDLLTARVHLFKALADRTRLRILDLLAQEGEMRVTEIYLHLGRPQNLVSHHLACLKNCGMITSRRQGTHIYYRLRNQNALRLFDRADKHAREVLDALLSCEVVSEEMDKTATNRRKRS